MRCAGLLLLKIGILLIAQTSNCASQYIGNSEPMPIGQNGVVNEPSNLDVYDLSGLPGMTIASALNSQYEDRSSLTTRGRHDIEIYKSISPGVVIVVAEGGLGSGSYVGNDRILTNWHVIKNSPTVGVFFKPQKEGDKVSENNLLIARVLKVSPTLDLALLQLSSSPSGVQSINLASERDIQIGADVHAIGHPTGKAWTYTKGIISQYRKDFEWKTDSGAHKANVIQTQTPINPGNSGGPLITDDGKLVGVNSFKSQGEGLNFAVSIVDVTSFLQIAPPKSEPSRRPTNCQATKIYDGRDRQNVARLIQYDTNCDGKADHSIVMPDDATRSFTAHLDNNFDGKTDISVEDKDRDGKWDISFHDVDFDGNIDLVGFHADGKITPTRFVKYVIGFKY